MKFRSIHIAIALTLLWLGGLVQAATPPAEVQPPAAKQSEAQTPAEVTAETELNCNPTQELMVISPADCAKYLRANVNPALTAKHVCLNCHDNDGNPVSLEFPRLAGQQKAYLVNQLTAFQEHTRGGQASRDFMWGVSTSLTTRQKEGLADYFSKQPPKPNPIGDTDRPRIEMGRQIFENGIAEKKILPCAFCHGPKALGLRSFPRLASQHSDYIVKALGEFKENTARPGTPMRQVTQELSPEEMRELGLYLQSLP